MRMCRVCAEWAICVLLARGQSTNGWKGETVEVQEENLPAVMMHGEETVFAREAGFACITAAYTPVISHDGIVSHYVYVAR